MRELQLVEIQQVNGGVPSGSKVAGGAFAGGVAGFLGGVGRGAALGAGRGILGGLGGMIFGAAIGASYVLVKNAFSARLSN